MNNTLRWYEADRWVQRLENNPPYFVPTESYPFPMEEVLYQLLLNADQTPPVSSCGGLNRLWEEYRTLTPDAAVTPEELVHKGWLCVCCDRWRVAGRRHGVFDGTTGTVFRALDWLRNRQNEAEGVLIRDASNVLSHLREVYPLLPEAEWFMQRYILSADGTHLIYKDRRQLPYLYGALVRLWFHGGLLPEEWTELASSLHVSSALIQYFPSSARKDVAEVLASRFLRGAVPTLEQLNNSVNCFYACERGETELKQTTYLVEDDIERLTNIESGIFENVLYDLLPQDLLSFEVASVAENIDYVQEELRPKVLERLAALHRIGGMSAERLTPRAAIALLAYSESRPLALLIMAAWHRMRAQQGDPTVGNALLAWLRFALEQPVMIEVSSLCEFLSYLAEFAYRGMRQDRADAELLQTVLLLFARAAARDARFAEKLSSALSSLLSLKASDVTWCRRFHLLCDWAEQVCGELPEVLTSAEQVSLRCELTNALTLLLGTPYEKRAAFVPSSIFALHFWPKLFTAVDLQTRFRLRTTVRTWYDDTVTDHDQLFQARYQFVLALAWLAALVKAFPNDKALSGELEELLVFALHRDNMILSGAFAAGNSQREALRSAIAAVRLDAQAESPLLELDLGALVTILAYAQDETLKARIKSCIEHILLDEEAMDDLRWADSFDLVFAEHLESLYDFCDRYLSKTYEEQIQKGRKDQPYSKRLLFQLSHLWYVRGEKERILQKGDDWWRARVYMEEGQQQNLRRAAETWKVVARKSRRSDAYLNWMLSLLLRMEQLPDKSADTVLRQNIAELQEEIESVHWPSWGSKDQLQYARLRVFYAKMCGYTEEESIERISSSLKLDASIVEELRAVLVEKEPKMTLPQDTDSLYTEIASAIRDYRALPFSDRARVYLRSIGADNRPDAKLSVLLFLVINAVYRLQMYGDKLTVWEKLYEDHCTQLLREMFMALASECWRLTAHDQQQSGSTGRKNAQGVNNSAENDLVIYDLGHEQMVIEALVSESIDWNNAWEHLYKLIGDGRNRPIMLLIYGHSKQSVRDREAMMQLVRKEMQEPQIKEVRFTELRPLSDVENLYIPGLFVELPKELVEYCMVTEVSHPGHDNFPLFVLYADITRRANVEISKQARERKPSPKKTVV